MADNPRNGPQRLAAADETQPLLSAEGEHREEQVAAHHARGSLWTSALCIFIGSVMGALVCLTNIHFGLQTGYINIMQMQSALVGFAAMNTLVKHTAVPFGRGDNIFIQTVSSAIGATPSAAGLIGVIPALEYLVQEPVRLSFARLCAWSAGISIFGLLFSAVMRRQIVLQDKLRFPTGTASALLVNVLHGSDKAAGSDLHDSGGAAPQPDSDDQGLQLQKLDWRSSVSLISSGAAISAVYTIVTFFIPILRDLPIFGRTAAAQWLWTVNFSPGYFGQGIITGLPALLNMLAGAIVGWGLLSPIAKFQGWAPGPVPDWDTGSRGWIIWVSLSIMLADAIVGLAAFIVRSLWPNSQLTHSESTLQGVESEMPSTSTSSRLNLYLLLGLAASILVCLGSVKLAFGEIVSTRAVLASIVIALPLCLMGINAVGSTDHNPASGIAKISQLIIGGLIRDGSHNAVVENLVAGGVAEAGVVTAGFLMQTFKTAYLTESRPTRMLFGMIYGNIIGAVMASSLYRLYANVYTVPGQIFGVPSAYVWRAGAKLAVGQNLPSKVPEFSLVMGICFAIFSTARIVFHHRRWSVYLPSGVPFAVGMYLVPSFTLARAAGAIAAYYWSSVLKRPQASLFIWASGLVLGEGLASIVNLLLESLHVPHL